MSLKIKNVEGYIVPIGNNTKLRKEHSTYSDAIGTYNAGAKVYIDKIVERLESDTSNPHNYKGDVWGRVVAADGSSLGYMAIMYHNTSTFAPYRICNEFYVVRDGDVPDEEPDSSDTVFPDFILVNGTEGGLSVEKKYVPEV